eukprot:353684-Chlamydomonas_euryale.AAC.3
MGMRAGGWMSGCVCVWMGGCLHAFVRAHALACGRRRGHGHRGGGAVGVRASERAGGRRWVHEWTGDRWAAGWAGGCMSVGVVRVIELRRGECGAQDVAAEHVCGRLRSEPPGSEWPGRPATSPKP